jgi:hypothetical protein
VMAAGPAGVPAVRVDPFPSRPGSPATYPWMVFALVGQWGPLTRVIALIAVTWQRIRTPGGVLPSTISAPLVDRVQAATDPEEVLVNALRAARRVACILIRWLVARATVFPAVVTMFRVPSHRSTPHHGHRSGPSGSNGFRNPEPARGNGSRSASGQNRCATRETVFVGWPGGIAPPGSHGTVYVEIYIKGCMSRPRLC